LGDVVAAATKAVGIEPCEGCKRRREKLNKWFKFARGKFGVSLFEPFRGHTDYEKLLTQHPRSHPWRRRGLTPDEIERAQRLERELMSPD
jgi:hypothetical protein